VIAAIALAAGVVPWLVLPVSLETLVYGACGVAAAALAAHFAGWLGTAHGIDRVTWHADGRWTLSTRGEPPVGALLLGDSRVAGRWLWLRWRTDQRSLRRVRSMLITVSDLPPGQWRQLAVRVRLQGRTRTPVASLRRPGHGS
jgi:hypothetical protein